MRDEIVNLCCKTDKNFIFNLDDSSGPGTHWVCVFTKNGKCFYFDSYGFEPPSEITNYRSGYFSTYKIQSVDEVICGHYCIYVIYQMSRGVPFHNVLHELYEWKLSKS